MMKLCETCEFARMFRGNCNEAYTPGAGLFAHPECRYYLSVDYDAEKQSEADNRVYEE